MSKEMGYLVRIEGVVEKAMQLSSIFIKKTNTNFNFLQIFEEQASQDTQDRIIGYLHGVLFLTRQ